MSDNTNALKYLAYYAAFTQPPGFAVLVNGPWGIGKTHLIQAFTRSVETPDFQAVYVSLNGLKTFEEIDRELFRVMHTVLGHKFFEAALSLGKAGLKAVKGITFDINVLDLVNRYAAHLYVFDDLERCAMPAVQVLGYINAFVEHGKRKVIIVANEAEIDEPNYGRTREKVVGQVLERFRFELSRGGGVHAASAG